MTLRVAGADDAPELARVFVAAWRSGYRGLVPDDVIDALDETAMSAEFAAGLGRTDLITVLAEDGSQVDGFVRFGADRDAPDDGYVAALYVHPAAAGRGLGRMLLRHALGELGPRDVTLWVFEGNERALRLYRSAGFEPDGERLTDPRWRTPQLRLRRHSAPSR